jgi:hypothetical protein
MIITEINKLDNAVVGGFFADKIPTDTDTTYFTEVVCIIPNIQKPFFNPATNTYYEGATAEEIRASDPKKQPEYYKKRIEDGINYISIKTQALVDYRDAGAINEATFEAIDNAVKEVRNALLGGQWKSALRELKLIETKLSPAFYADLFNHINNYCNENY